MTDNDNLFDDCRSNIRVAIIFILAIAIMWIIIGAIVWTWLKICGAL